MNRIGRKIKQMLTMLLVVSILSGSVPANAHELVDLVPKIEHETIAEVEKEMTDSEVQIEENIAEHIVDIEETAGEKIGECIEIPDDKEEITYSEEGILQSVSMNNTNDTEEVVVQEVTEEVVDIIFSVSDNSYAPYVKVIQIHEESPETEVEDNKVSAVVGKALKFRIEVAEDYKIAMVKMGSSMIPEVEGVYTAYPAAAGTIEIKVAKLKKYDVTFSYKEEFVKELTVKMGRTDVTLEENIAKGMLEDSIISVTPVLAEMAKVVKVTANEKEIQSEDGITYVLPPLEGDVQVEIEASLDDSKCNTLDIGVIGHHNSVSVKNNGVLYENGTRLLSGSSSEEIVIVPNGNYEVDRIILNNTVTIYDKKLDKEDKFSTGMAAYNIDFSKNKNQVIFIYTTPKKSNEKKKIVFANRAENITYEVVTHAIGEPDRIIVEKDAGKNDTYTINEGETLVEFKVIAKEGYEPDVNIEGVEYDLTVKDNVYTYSLAVATLGNGKAPTEITIDEITQYRTVSVVYDADKLEELSVIEDGKYIKGKESYDGTKKLTIHKFICLYGTELVLQLKAKKGFTFDVIKETAGEEILSEIKPQIAEYSYTVKVDKDKNVELQSDDVYATRVYDVQEESCLEVEDEKGIYSVESKGKYKVHLYNGAQLQVVSKAVLKSGSKTYQNNVKITDSENVYVEIPEQEIGKKMVLELTYKEGSQEHILSMEMKVLPRTKITKITGISKGKVSQTADTIKTYKFTSNLKETEGRFGVEIVTAKEEEDIISETHRKELNEKANADFEAKIVDNELEIFVKTSKENEQAYVKLYDVLRSTKTKKHYIENGTILVTSKAPAFIKAKPTVSQKSATNLNLILNLGIKNFEKVENGELWYKIEGTPKITEKTEEDVKKNVFEFVRYVRCTGKSQTDSVRVVGVSENSLKEGELKQKADFEIKVSLVQTTDKNEPNGNNETRFVSKTSDKKKMSTKVPAYETKLGLKTIKGTLYSGQQDVIVATPVFSKNTTYQEITCVSRQEGIYVTVDEKNNILVSVDKTVEPGKYVIEVIAQAAENTVPSTKNLNLQVVQGIYEISLDVPKQLYKGYQKKATFKVGITYNEESKVQPKTKKVEWSLQDSKGNEINKKHPYYQIFSVKNGVVTIHKDYLVTEGDKFRVKAVAKDYEQKGKEIAGYSDWIQITNKKATLGELVLVKKSAIEKGIYNVTARSGNKAFIDEVHNSQIVILKKGTPERDKYTEEDFMTGLDELLVYSSDNKAVTIEEKTVSSNAGLEVSQTVSGNATVSSIQTVSVNAIAGNVNITAKMQDGSNVKTQLSNVNVCAAEAGDLGLVVKMPGNQMSILDSYSGCTTEFYGVKDEAFTIKIQEKVNGISQDIFGAEHQLKVQGAKIVKSQKLTGEYDVVATSETIVLQLINSAAGYTKTFTLKNMSLIDKKVQESKPLKLSVKGSLKTGYFTEEQTVTYTLPKESIGKYTHAWVTVDRLDYYNKKKTAVYDEFLKASGGTIGEIQRLGRDGKVLISFGPVKGEEKYYIPEKDFTYKLNISFGTLTEDYEFKAGVKSTSVSCKTKVEKLPEAPLNTSYSISAKEKGKAELTLKNKKVTLFQVGKLMNKNVNGVQNKFTDYFEISEEDAKYVIKLKTGVDVSKIAKNDLSGYISRYTYTNGEKEKTVYHANVKVTLKDLVQKYTLSKATVLTKDKINTNVKLLCGTQDVKVKYAYVPQGQNFNVTVNDDGTLKLQSKAGMQVKSGNKCVLYVIPEYSYYLPVVNEFYKDAASNEDEMMKVMTQYGVKLTATVSVKDKEKATGKIKFAGKDLKPKLTNENFEVREQEGAKLSGVYTLEVPYTKVVDWEVKEIGNVTGTTSLVKVEKTNGKDSVTLTLDKETLRNAYKEDKAIYGKTITVKAVAKFGEGTKDENITFKVKLPKQPVQLKTAIDELNKIDWTDLNVQYEGLDKEQLAVVNQSEVEKKVEEVLSNDGDVEFTVSGNEYTSVPTKETEGEIGYTIILTDVATKPQEQKKFIVRIPLSKLFTNPLELTESLRGAIEYWESKKITNTTTISSILASVKSKVRISEYKYLRLYAKQVQTTPASLENAGRMRGSFCIINVADRNAGVVELPFEFEIPKLMTLDEAVIAVKDVVEKIIVYNVDLKDNKKNKTEEILEAAKEALEGQEYYLVQIKQGSSLQGTLAEGDSIGKASLKLEVVSVTTERLSKDVTCEFKVLETEK